MSGALDEIYKNSTSSIPKTEKSNLKLDKYRSVWFWVHVLLNCIIFETANLQTSFAHFVVPARAHMDPMWAYMGQILTHIALTKCVKSPLLMAAAATLKACRYELAHHCRAAALRQACS